MELNEENTEIVTADIENFEGEEAKRIREQIEINRQKSITYQKEQTELDSLTDTLINKRLNLLYNKLEKIFKDSKLKNKYRIEKISNADFAIYEILDFGSYKDELEVISGSITDMLVILEMVKRIK